MTNKKQESGLAINEPQDETTRLISQAINKNVPVETMERLLAMRRELRAEHAKEVFDQAMAEFQKECPIIEKKTVAGSGSYSYKYASLDHIVIQVRDLLSKNGFSYTFDTRKTEHSLTTICNVKHIAGHAETSQFEIAIDSGARMNISQKDGAASSYGKRYAFCNAFGILTGDEDTDARVQEDKAIPPRQMREQVDEVSSSKPQYSDMATPPQVKYIKDLLFQKHYNEKSLLNKFEVTSLDELTFDQASECLTNLKKLPAVQKKMVKALPVKVAPDEDFDYDEIDKAISQPN